MSRSRLILTSQLDHSAPWTGALLGGPKADLGGGTGAGGLRSDTPGRGSLSAAVHTSGHQGSRGEQTGNTSHAQDLPQTIRSEA